MRCTFSSVEGGWRCDVCGRVVNTACPAPPIATCRPGLGDRVAAGLAAVGITKDLVQAAASKVGIKDCGCKRRQAAANSLGHKYLGMSPGSTASE